MKYWKQTKKGASRSIEAYGSCICMYSACVCACSATCGCGGAGSNAYQNTYNDNLRAYNKSTTNVRYSTSSAESILVD